MPFGVAAVAANGAEVFLTRARAVVQLPDRDGISAVLVGVGIVAVLVAGVEGVAIPFAGVGGAAVLTVGGSQGVNSCDVYQACHKTSWGLNSCLVCFQSSIHSTR